MTATLLFVQTLNGLQFGLILFLIAAGLTLVFGVMDFVNLAHGVQYMVGAYLAAAFTAMTGSFLSGLLLALPAALAFGLFLEILVFRHLYDRDHLDQVLATFGIILFLDQAVKYVGRGAALRADSRGAVGVGRDHAGAALSGLSPRHHRRGPRRRPPPVRARQPYARRHAGAGRRHQRSHGVGPRRQHPAPVHDGLRFGAMLGFAGAMVAPLLSVEPGMGDNLILAFVVIVIGGIGSIRGAFVAASSSVSSTPWAAASRPRSCAPSSTREPPARRAARSPRC